MTTQNQQKSNANKTTRGEETHNELFLRIDR